MNYKVTRIGLLNFWYFDEEEFHFSDGKILLRGENGSGKSVTMQSFIPLILDGNKSPSRLDPFGSKEKRIEDYLLGPSDGIQKEDAIGYLYMEVYQEEKNKYLTIGMGLRARKGQGTDFWGFALKDGKRIGEDFLLYKDYGQKILLTKKELRARLGVDNEYTESTKEYKRIVNNLLFGFKELDSYDEFINVLLQLRSSKLSKEYTPTKLMDILSSVLQPLTEDDIRPLSEAIEDTNKTKEKIESLEKQVKSLTNLLKTYQNYNEIILYHKALSVSNQNRIIKEKRQRIEEENQQIESVKTRLTEIEMQFSSLEKEYIENQAKLETIDNKDLKKYTQDLVELKDKISKTELNVQSIQKKLEAFFQKERNTKQEIENNRDKVDANEKELVSICDDISSLSEEIKLMDIRSVIGKIVKQEEVNFEYLEERVSKYKTRLNQVKTKLEEKEKLEENLNHIEEERLKQKKEFEIAEKQLQNEEKHQAEKIDEFKDKINILEKENQIVALTHEIKEKIFAWIRPYSYENYLLAKDLYQRLSGSYEKEALEEKSHISHKISIESKELEQLQGELQLLKDNEELEIEEEPEIVSKLQNLQIPYVPLYKVIEFKEQIVEEEKNKIEELLLSMNILNSKIVPKKYLTKIREINTIFIKAGAKKAKNLLHYFNVVDNSEINKEEIIEILSSISINPQENSYINPNSYQLDFIIGYPGSTYQSKYIGIMKRREEHQRKVQEKEKEIKNKESIILNYQNILESVRQKIEKIQLEKDAFPSNKELEAIEKQIQRLETSLEILRKQDNELTNQITEITKMIEQKMQEIRECKANITLPLNLASYKEALELTEVLSKDIYRLINVYQTLERNKERSLSLENMLSDIREDIEYQNAELSDKNRDLDKLTSSRTAIQQILDNPNNKKLIEELQKLTQRQQEIPNEKVKIGEEKGEMKTTLANLEQQLLEIECQLQKDALVLEVKQSIFEKEYQLHYVYSEEEYNCEKILIDLKDKKNSDIGRALANYLQSYNDYRLDLLEYRLNTREIFTTNEEIIETYTDKGLEAHYVESLLNEAIRQDMTSIYQGKIIDIYKLEECLRQAITESESYINTQERHLFEDILLKTVGNKIRDKIESSKKWVIKINEIMRDTQMDSNLSFQLEWKSKVAFTEEELDTKELVRLFKIDAGQLDPKDSEKLITHFRSQIKKELEYNEKKHESYASIISRVLDYRTWFEFKLYYKRKSGERKELTNKVFFVLSGGERAKSMYVPLFAAVYAKLLTARQDSLRLIALDEAFAGVDQANVREMFAILSKLDLDYILTSQALWGDYDSVKAMSICQLIKDEVNKAVGIRRYLWNGHSMEMLEGIESRGIYE